MALLQLITGLFVKPVADPATASLYLSCVTQARRPEFYRDLGVPDTVDGRFDLLLLHVFLLIRRMGDKEEAKQKLFDLMFADMDRSLREMGVGDMSIGKKMKPMLAAFYGRAHAYEAALAAGTDELAVTLGKNLYGKTVPPPEALHTMADYVTRAVRALAGQRLDDIVMGRIQFPATIGS